MRRFMFGGRRGLILNYKYEDGRSLSVVVTVIKLMDTFKLLRKRTIREVWRVGTLMDLLNGALPKGFEFKDTWCFS